MPVTVNDVMSRSVICINENSTVKEASTIMTEKGISSLLVEKNGKIIGIITEKDIVSRFLRMNMSPSQVFVSEIMSSQIIKINIKDGLGNAVNLMINNNIKKLLVFKENCEDIVGIISIYDIVMYQPELISYIRREHSVNTRHIRHDLQGALLTINSSVAVIERNREQIPKCIDIIKKTTNYIKNILEDWKKNEDRFIINLEHFDISVLLNSALKTVYIPDNIQIKTSIIGEEKIFLDYNKMTRLLSNLIKNSVEAIEGEGKIEIQAISTPKDITFIIKDTGHGISLKIIDRIFEPLFSTKPTGLGLGLSYVKEVVEAQGGRVTVNSEINKETVFTLCFPIMNQ
jgi:signal transduction histidine kinase